MMSFQQSRIKKVATSSIVAASPLFLGMALVLLVSCRKSNSESNITVEVCSDSAWKTKMSGIDESQAPAKSMPYHPRQQEYTSRFEVGANYTHVNLKPDGNPSFHGNLGGLQASYEYRPRNSIYGAAKFAWRQGSTHGSAGSRSLLYFDGQERLGYTFGFHCMDSLLTLFSGIGYRYIGQKLDPKSGSSLRFRYNEFYVPVGLLTNHTVSSWFAFGVGFTWMPQIFPTVSIAPLGGTHWSIKDTYANFFVEVPLDFTLSKNKRFHLIINPFYEHWKDGRSTAKTSTGIPLGLPGNTYDFWGVNVNFGYCF